MLTLLLCAQLAWGQASPPADAEDAAAPLRDDYLRQRSRLMFELNAWGDANLIGSGLAFLVARGPFARAVELQMAVWGLADAAVAVFHLREARREKAQGGGLEVWTALRQRAHHGHRLDAALDLALLVAALGAWRLLRAERWRGVAAGVALQCGFLALFNSLAALAFGS